VRGALLFLLVACQPLDRRDGALVIELLHVRSEVDAYRVVVRADGRSFEEMGRRPSDDVIRSFTAVPAGRAEVDVELFAGRTLVHSRVGQTIEIAEDAEATLTLNLEDGPEFEIIEPKGEYQLRTATSIVVVVQPTNAELDVVVRATANGEAIEMQQTGTDYVGTISPSLAGAVLPAPIVLEVTVCLAAAPEDCRMRSQTITVTRASWRAPIASQSRSRAVAWGDALVQVDGGGTLRVFTASTGVEKFSIALGTPVAEDIAIADDVAYATARDGRLFEIDLVVGAAPRSFPLGATSAPVAGEIGLVVAADRDVLVDRSVVATMPGRVRAPPLVDEFGIVAADLFGNVVALDESGAMLFMANVGAPVFAAPVRYGTGTAIATSAGSIVQLDANGLETVPRVELMQPIAFAPAVIDVRLIAASGDRVVFIEGSRVVASLSVNDTITGAPVGWIDGGAIVGTQSGLVRRVTDTASKPIERVRGAALGALVLPAIGAIAAVGSDGELVLIEPEESF
jgi:hypothetical protein